MPILKLEHITPLILTYNEQPNLLDTLQRLDWASQILLVDSFSTDDTLEIAARFPQVRVVQRTFDHFAEQCNFGLLHIESPWVLSMDADYKLEPAFARELLTLEAEHSGYQAAFCYAIYGHRLRATLYPPRTVLYRADKACYHRDGHAHRVQIAGTIGKLSTKIVHDDCKPLSKWCESQIRYAQSEACKLTTSGATQLCWKDRIRSYIVFSPILTLFYCLIIKRLILDGWPGVFYTFQRVFAELLLSLALLDVKLRKRLSIRQDEKPKLS